MSGSTLMTGRKRYLYLNENAIEREIESGIYFLVLLR